MTTKKKIAVWILFIVLIGLFVFYLFFVKIQTEERTTKTERAVQSQTYTKSPLIEEGEKKEITEEIILPSTEHGTYEEYRYFDSDVHVYISGKGEKLAISMGETGLQPLKDISLPEEVAKMNLGMFDTTFEHGGMYLVNGKYIQPPMKRYIDLHYYKNGRIDIRNYDENLSNSEVTSLLEDTHFVVGTTYSLVQDGEINLENADVFENSRQRNPRSLFGQREDGAFVFATVDGRSSISRGVTAEQSAQIMFELGCVEAVNLDGGGSSTLIVNGELKNHPSDGNQRRIGSAIFIIQ